MELVRDVASSNWQLVSFQRIWKLTFIESKFVYGYIYHGN